MANFIGYRSWIYLLSNCRVHCCKSNWPRYSSNEFNVTTGATTAIALPISESIGGIPAITSFAVIFNAVIVYALGALFLKTFRVKHPIAKGLALGTAGHALGVAVGIEMGEVEARWLVLR